jgi:hydroxymethylbilane synthase
LGIEIRSSNQRIAALLAPLNHADTAACVRAERQVSRVLGGSCQVPLGAYAVLDGQTLRLSGFVANPDGSNFLHAMASGTPADPEAVGQALADQLLAQGARAILDALPPA